MQVVFVTFQLLKVIKTSRESSKFARLGTDSSTDNKLDAKFRHTSIIIYVSTGLTPNKARNHCNKQATYI